MNNPPETCIGCVNWEDKGCRLNIVPMPGGCLSYNDDMRDIDVLDDWDDDWFQDKERNEK